MFKIARRLLGLLTATVMICSCGSIKPTSQVSIAPGAKVSAILVVNAGVSAPALANIQGAVVAQLRRQLVASGLRVQALTVGPNELEPKAMLDRAIRSFHPTHLMQLTVPSAMVGSTTGTVRSSTVHVEIVDVATRTPVWKYTAQVSAGPSATNADIATSIVEKMRVDGLL